MPNRARYNNQAFKLASDLSTVQVVPGSTVTLYEPGTTTPIAQVVYRNPTGTAPGDILGNPFTADSYGNIIFYLDTPQRVKISASGTGVGPLIADYEPVMPDPADFIAYNAPNTINDLGINLTAGHNFDVKVAGTSKFRVWGTPGVNPGSVGIQGGLFIREGDAEGSIYDQSPTMFLVQRLLSTDAGYTFATLNAASQASSGDNVALSVFLDQNAGGATSTAQVRILNLEASRGAGVSTQVASSDKVLEAGMHIRGYLDEYMDSTGFWAYKYGTGGGAQIESQYAKIVLFLLSDSDQHDPGHRWRRNGVGLLMTGVDGFDWPVIVESENFDRMMELDHRGRTQFRPASFSRVLYEVGGAFTDYTLAANRSLASASDTVQLPTGASNTLYLRLPQVFNSIHFAIGTANAYAAGATILMQVATDNSTWIDAATNQPANGSVLTDGTRGANGPFEVTGDVTFAPPAAWARTTPTVLASVDAVPGYWARIIVTGTASSQNGLADVIRPGRANSFEVMFGANDATPGIAGGSNGYANFGLGWKIGTGAPRRKLLRATTTWSVPSLTNGQVSSVAVTVAGAVHDGTNMAKAALSTLTNTGGIALTAQVVATNTVLVTLRNDTGGTLALSAGGTLTVEVEA